MRVARASRWLLVGLLTVAAPGRAAGVQDAVTIEYLAHASFVITSPSGVRVLLDPYASRVWLGYDFPDGVAADVVVISHPHYDHDGGKYRGGKPPWPDAARVIEFPGRFEIDDVRVIGVPGKHADPYGREFGQFNTLFVVETGGLRIAHLGDNGPLTTADFDALGALDFLLIPIDDEEHILAHDQVAAAVDRLQPRVVVPMHYRLAQLEVEADSPSDLGGIEEWLASRAVGARRLGVHLWNGRSQDLPRIAETWVFEPSPRVVRAGSG